MNTKHRRFIALYLAGIGAIGAFASVSAASISAGTTTQTRDQIHTAIKQAFATGDYQTFLAVTKKDDKDEPIITEAQFNAMIEAQKLRAAGDMAGAKKILDDAGIKPPVHGKTGKGGHHELRKEMKGHMPALTDAQKETMKQARELMKAGKKNENNVLLEGESITHPSHRGHITASTTGQ